MNRLLEIQKRMEVAVQPPQMKKRAIQKKPSNGTPTQKNGEASKTAVAKGLSNYTYQQNPAAAAPALFGIAGLTAVDAASLGLAGISLLQPLAQQSGSLVYSSDQAERVLTNEARAEIGSTTKKIYQYPVLWVGELKQGFADALFEIKWEGNAFGEIAGAHVVRNIHKTTTWSKSSLNVSFKRIQKLPPNNEKDPRKWPIVFEYDGSFDPYGNGQFEFSGEFWIDAFGGLNITRHDISDKSFWSAVKIGKKEDYVKKQSNQAAKYVDIPQKQKEFLLKKLGQ